jgi:tetratricopeptide (TPR) repeat protein
MTNTANQSTKFSFGLFLAIILSLICHCAQATKLDGAPLPHESDRASKDFSTGQEAAPELSRFKRRPDYREEEAQKKADADKAAKDAEIAKQKAIEASQKARQEQIENYKRSIQEAVDANNEGVQLGRQGKWEQGIQAHEKAIQLDPSNKQFRINLSAARCAFGQQRLAGGDYSSAAYLFRKALTAAPDNALAGKMLLEALRKSGINPSSADARLGVGDQLAAAGDLEGAAIEYQAAMQLEDSGRTYVKMGDMSCRYGQMTTAMAWYRQAIAKDPDYGPAHRQLGLIQLSQKDTTGAAASLRKALILDPKDSVAGETLVEIWRKQVAANPTFSENYLGLAGALQLTGDFVGAESAYNQVQTIDPKNAGLAAGRASLARAYQHANAEKHKLATDTLFNQGLKREALAEISQAVMLEPRNASYQFLLAECLEANGDYKGAHQAYLTCVLIDPANNKEAAARMARMQMGAGNAVNVANTNQFAGNYPNNNYRPANPPPTSYAQVGGQGWSSGTASSGMLNSTPPAPAKDTYEAGPGSNTAMNSPSSPIRTHDEAANRGGRPSALPAPPQIDAGSLAKVEEAESSHDYKNALDMLRQLSSNDMNNSDIHHRIAVDLMASGDISEAISEFRIASALTPGRKDYAEDLARALSIHKRSLMSASGTGGDAVSTEKSETTNGVNP